MTTRLPTMKRQCLEACDNDVFTAFPMSRVQLEPVLGVTRGTIKRWEKILYWRLEAFRQQYPNTYINGKKQKNNTAKLRPYQVWCLSRFGRLSRYHTIEEMKVIVTEQPEIFSIHQYKHASKELKNA